MIEDYSQDHEQAAILKALLGQTDASLESLKPIPDYDCRKRFLDIGAWNAKTFSNVRALYELGWGGVMIEPSPGPVQGLVEEYGNCDRIKVIAAAVGVEAGLVEMRITNDAVSTSEPGNLEQWKDRGGFYGSLTVPVITLADIFNRYGRFDFVNIDAEGLSVHLLKVLVDTEMFPRCICAEHDGRIVEAMGWAQARGYKAVFTNQANLVLSL